MTKKSEIRHYSEEEILMHLFADEDPSAGKDLACHLEVCKQCFAIWQEMATIRTAVASWKVPVIAEDIWTARKTDLMRQYRQDQSRMRRRWFFPGLYDAFQVYWNYAMENPLPTTVCIAVGLAFASAQTITMFHLDQILPATDEVLDILGRIL